MILPYDIKDLSPDLILNIVIHLPNNKASSLDIIAVMLKNSYKIIIAVLYICIIYIRTSIVRDYFPRICRTTLVFGFRDLTAFCI